MSSKPLRPLCGTVLILEAVVIGLAIPVAIVQEHLRGGVAGGVGGGLAVCALLLGGMVGRPGQGWVLWAGTVLQALVIAAGVVVPAMYILGVIFAALWITGIWLARRLQAPPAPRAPGAPTRLAPTPARRRPAGRRHARSWVSLPQWRIISIRRRARTRPGSSSSWNPVSRRHRCPSKNPSGRFTAWTAKPTLTVADLQPGSEGSRSR